MKKFSQSPKKRVAISRNQLYRLARIAALLQKNTCPGPERLLKEYVDLELFEGKGKSRYCRRTVLRDIKVLQNDFDCPVRYDRARKGYYLTRRDWRFNCPTDLTEATMLTLIIGAKVVEDIFPSPLREQVKSAVDEILKNNNPDFLDTACVNSLKIFAETGAIELTTLFPEVFRAWLEHRSLKITYDNGTGEISTRVVDPHVLFLYNKEWRIKAFCHLKNAPRTFVISRMKSAEITDREFTPDLKIIESVRLDTIVGFRQVRDVKIRLTVDTVKFARANKFHSGQKISPEPSGNGYIFHIPEISVEVITPWILAQGGGAVPLAPAEVVTAARRGATALLNCLAKEPKN